MKNIWSFFMIIQAESVDT